MSQTPTNTPDVTPERNSLRTETSTSSQSHRRTGRPHKRVHFSHNTAVRVFEYPEADSAKFGSFRRFFTRTCPCLKIQVAPFWEYTKETDFEEKKGDLAKVGMPPRKRSSIGEIDLSNLKTQLEKLHQLSEKMMKVAEEDEKFRSQEKLSSHSL